MKIVLLPGLDGTGDLFSHFRRALPQTYNVQTVMYPFKEGLGYDVLAEYTADVLPVNEPFVLLAESFSGPIGVAMAAEQLPQMKGLILVNTFLSNPNALLLALSVLLPNGLLKQPPRFVLNWFLSRAENNAMDVADDALVSRWATKQLLSSVPHTQSQRISTNHFLLQCMPAESADIVNRFIATHC